MRKEHGQRLVDTPPMRKEYLRQPLDILLMQKVALQLPADIIPIPVELLANPIFARNGRGLRAATVRNVARPKPRSPISSAEQRTPRQRN